MPRKGRVLLSAHRMVLPVRMRIQPGMPRFWFCFFASVFFVRSDLWAGCLVVVKAVASWKKEVSESDALGWREKSGVVGKKSTSSAVARLRRLTPRQACGLQASAAGKCAGAGHEA